MTKVKTGEVSAQNPAARNATCARCATVGVIRNGDLSARAAPAGGALLQKPATGSPFIRFDAIRLEPAFETLIPFAAWRFGDGTLLYGRRLSAQEEVGHTSARIPGGFTPRGNS